MLYLYIYVRCSVGLLFSLWFILFKPKGCKTECAVYSSVRISYEQQQWAFKVSHKTLTDKKNSAEYKKNYTQLNLRSEFEKIDSLNITYREKLRFWCGSWNKIYMQIENAHTQNQVTYNSNEF